MKQTIIGLTVLLTSFLAMSGSASALDLSVIYRDEPMKQILGPTKAELAEQKRLAEEAEKARLAEVARLAEKARTDALKTARIKPNAFAYGNCTYLVAGILNIPWTGNANRWDDNARSMGYIVNETPYAGDVAQSDAGYWGHVALVLSVQGNTVLIREMNYRGFNVDTERVASIAEFKYIHL